MYKRNVWVWEKGKKPGNWQNKVNVVAKERNWAEWCIGNKDGIEEYMEI